MLRAESQYTWLFQELTLWSLQTGKRVNNFSIESARSQVNSMVINHNGRQTHKLLLDLLPSSSSLVLVTGCRLDAGSCWC